MITKAQKNNVIFIITVIVILTTLLGCNSRTDIAIPTIILPEQQSKQPCDGGINKPVRFIAYDWKTDPLGRDPAPDGDKTYAGKLRLDTEKPNKGTDTTAVRIQGFTLKVDDYFTGLVSQRFGAWDGCYGNDSTKRIMTIRLHFPGEEKFICGWQGKSYAEVLLHDDCLTPTAIAHEWTHGLVERTLGLRPDDVPSARQAAAMSESLSDIFAVIIADPDNSYTVDKTTGIYRNLADPASTRQKINRSDFIDKGEREYVNSGIFSHAAYLLMDVRRAEGTPPEFSLEKYPVEPIGKEKVGKILFHSLSPTFVKHLTPDEHEYPGEYTFEEMALGVVAACDDLIVRKPDDIKDTDCMQVKMAFCSVGILSECSETNVTSAPEAESAITFPGYFLRFGKNTAGIGHSITMVDPKGNNERLLFETDDDMGYFAWNPENKIGFYIANYPDFSDIPYDERIEKEDNATFVVKAFRPDQSAEVIFQGTGYLPSLLSVSPDGKSVLLRKNNPEFPKAPGPINPQSPPSPYPYKNYILNTETREIREYPSGDIYYNSLWSPNSQFSALFIDDSIYKSDLNIVNQDNLQITKLPLRKDFSFNIFAWAPDSRTIYFYGSKQDDPWTNGVFSINVDGEVRTIIPRTGLGCPANMIRLSPDGNWLAFTGPELTSEQRGCEPSFTWIFHPDGTGLSKLTLDACVTCSLIWSPDSKYLLIETSSGRQIVDLNGKVLFSSENSLSGVFPQWFPP